MEYDDYYEEEEEVMYLPVDDHFCQVMDSYLQGGLAGGKASG